MEHEFYIHLERFPHHQNLSEGILEEFVGLITHGCVGELVACAR